MNFIGQSSKFLNQQCNRAAIRCAGCLIAAAVLLAATGIAVAQESNAAAPAPETKFSTPTGYTSHNAIDIGGRLSDLVGSGDMYDTLVNLQKGPRMQGENYELHALPGNQHALVDDLSIFGSGFGGDPYTIAKINANKAKLYEFSGLFRRNRLYSNYDLLANPNIPGGQSIMNMVNGVPTPAQAWPQIKESPVKFNTVRRMSDGNLTLMPFAVFSVRLGYSHTTIEGPTLSPSYTLMGMKYNALLQQYDRNGSDDYLGAIDWKPQPATKITLEMQANHYKSDTSFMLDPNGFYVQEANGLRAYLGNYTALQPYGNYTTAQTFSANGPCTVTSMGSGYSSNTNYSILTPSNKPGGLPIINPACAVVTSYLRTLPTRTWTPTESLRVQSTAVKNLIINGNVHYTRGSMNMPAYYENSQGLNGQTLSGISSGGHGTAQHTVIGTDFGLIWRISPVFSLGDQVTYSSTHEPSNSIIPAPVTLNTPKDPTSPPPTNNLGNQTINYSGALTTGTGSLPHGINGTLIYNYYGQDYVINNATLSWDASARARFAFTYRYSNRNIGQGVPHQGPIPLVVSDPVAGTISINENAGVFNAALRPAKNWDLNGTVEIGYADNAFTAVGQRQFKTYRVHTTYKPNGMVTLSGSYSDRERHNNTNNNQAAVSAGDANYNGPINHVDYNRIGSFALVLAPNEHYDFNVNYSYSDVYAATNICYSSGAAVATLVAPAIAGAATVTSTGAPNLCSGNATWLARDFMSAPTQLVSAVVGLSPDAKLRFNLGYTLSDVNGSRFFNDARDVNGSMVSKYQTPLVNVAYTMHPGLIWKAEYKYFGYGEGGTSGSALCSTATSTTATITPCASIGVPTGMTEGTAGATAPRVFHANNVELGVHYEF